MATSNPVVTAAWTKLAESSDVDLLVTWETPVVLEVATTSANSAPAVIGHRVTNEDAITRSVIGPGYVWARTVAGSRPSSVQVVVSK